MREFKLSPLSVALFLMIEEHALASWHDQSNSWPPSRTLPHQLQPFITARRRFLASQFPPISYFFSDVWETFSHPSPDAEAPPQGGTSTETPASGTDEESNEEAEVNKQDAKEEGEGEQGHKPSSADEDEDEEEEEEEPQDPKDVLEKGEWPRESYLCAGRKLSELLRCSKQLFGCRRMSNCVPRPA